MARSQRAVKGRTHRRALLERAEGYSGSRSRHVRAAHAQVMHSGNYAFRARRARKGEFRKLWIMRINAALAAAINVLDAERVSPRFHAQHSAVARTYRYQCSTRRHSFDNTLVWWVLHAINPERTKDAADPHQPCPRRLA